MPSITISVPPFPAIPNLPGVPDIRRAVNALSPPPAKPLTGDTADASSGTDYQDWGIFDTTGSAILVGDTVFNLSYLREYRVSDYPVEQGAFASYNKVQLPFSARVIFLQGGSVNDKSLFLLSCATAAASLDLYQLVTPEVTYPNINVIHYDYDRKAAKGVGLMYVEIWVEEIRIAPPAAFSSTASPTSAPATNTGTVQSQAPTTPQAATVTQAAVTSPAPPQQISSAISALSSLTTTAASISAALAPFTALASLANSPAALAIESVLGANRAPSSQAIIQCALAALSASPAGSAVQAVQTIQASLAAAVSVTPRSVLQKLGIG